MTESVEEWCARMNAQRDAAQAEGERIRREESDRARRSFLRVTVLNIVIWSSLIVFLLVRLALAE